MGWYQRADYRWMLLADPPVCRAGRPEVVLANCDRLLKGDGCWCRFETQETIDDLAAIGAPGALDDWLTAGNLEARDVEDLRDRVVELARRARAQSELSTDAFDALDRLDMLARRLGRLVERGSGLSDRYADELE